MNKDSQKTNDRLDLEFPESQEESNSNLLTQDDAVENSAEVLLDEFFLAANTGDLDKVKLLVSEGMDPNSANANKQTALMFASVAGQLPVVEYLISVKADINCIDDCDNSASAFALMGGHPETIKYLQSARADFDIDAALISMTIQGELDHVQCLLLAGANIESKNKFGHSPLYLASNYGNLEMMKLLISAKADINSCANDGSSVLIVAVSNKKLEAVKYLVSEGADLNIVSDAGATAMSLACYLGLTEVVKFLDKVIAQAADWAANADATNQVIQFAEDNLTEQGDNPEEQYSPHEQGYTEIVTYSNGDAQEAAEIIAAIEFPLE